MLGFSLLSAAMLLLTILGGGILPKVTVITAIICCIGHLLVCFYAGKLDRRITLLTGLLIGMLIFSAIPLPPWSEFIFGSIRSDQNELARSAVQDAKSIGLVNESGEWFCLSRNRAGTLRMALLLLTVFSAAAIGSQMPGVWKDRYIRFVVIVGIAVAFLGYAGQWIYPQGKTFWWLISVPHGRPVACFLNRNHFGGFIAMLCPAAIILFADSFGRGKFWSSGFWGLGFGIMSLATLMSLSRGAWLAYIVSILSVTILLLVHRRVLMGMAVAFLLGVIAFAVIYLPHDELDHRLTSMGYIAQTQSGMMRMSTWFDTIMILPDYALLGTGANSFRMIFPQYRTATTRESFKHAENEYLQNLIELGIIGSMLVAGVFGRAMFLWRKTHIQSGTPRVLGFSVGGAVIVAMVHAVFDFPVRIPLYAFVLASFIGLVITPYTCHHRIHIVAGRRLVAPLLGILAVVLIGIHSGKIYDFDSSDAMMCADANRLAKMLTWSPTSWQAWYHLGRKAVADPSIDGVSYGHKCITQATEYDPNNYRLWAEICRLRHSLGDKQGAHAAYDRLRSLRTWVRIKEME
ncbi:MAG: O-antigen ligase family protein [Lentisphaerae bacterium]|nr:O-antigen ligase family protein [Lentisphaerota bacterium]